MRMTWLRLLAVVVLAEYVRERLILIALNSDPAIKRQGWRLYFNSTLPLALFVELVSARISQKISSYRRAS